MQPSPKPYGQRRSRVIKVAYLSGQSIDSTFLQGRPQNGPDAIGFWMRCSFPWASLPAARGRASFMITCPRQDLIDLVCLDLELRHCTLGAIQTGAGIDEVRFFVRWSQPAQLSATFASW